MTSRSLRSEFSGRLESLVKKAIARAVAMNRKLGAPVYILRDGKIVDIADEIPLEDDTPTAKTPPKTP